MSIDLDSPVAMQLMDLTNLTFNEKVKCQRIDTDSRIIFIYMVDKINLE